MPSIKVKRVSRNDEIGQMEATLTATNEAVIFLRQAVNMFIEKNLGDIDDPKQIKIKNEVQQDLNLVWEELNPS